MKTNPTKENLVVAGSFLVPPANIEGLRPHLATMISASLVEDGCIEYSYAEDIAEPGLIRVFEVWHDQDALNAHFKTQHMAAGIAIASEFGVSDQRLAIYRIEEVQPL